MEFSNFFDSNAGFRSMNDIKEAIKQSKNYQEENPDTAKVFMFFSTSKQKTYLVATSLRLYCILDDIRKEKPHINWSMPKKDLKNQNEIKINIVARDKTEKTGLVDIGEKHKNWLYTKNLFSTEDIKSSIEKFINNAM